jgi:hypothetical protein
LGLRGRAYLEDRLRRDQRVKDWHRVLTEQFSCSA